MTQTTQTTQPAGEATQETTSQPAETTRQASQEPTASNEPAKSAFLNDGRLPQKSIFLADGEPTRTITMPEPKINSQNLKGDSQELKANEELTAQIATLQARLDAMESQRTTERRTAEVERIIAPLSDTLKAVYRRTPFTTLTDEEYTQLRETISKEVSELATADKARGAVFSRPTASKPTDGKASDKETDEVIRRLNL